ncbi:MAG: U32 family peptidase [Methanomassiliicoccaceae archaeon]|jgi:putative protease|nr:U32 family peptidase [Methanomassiliicoccaceae archaeon]
MEILAPVGSPEALVAAIKGGADSVYLGGKRFGARKFSDNFDNGQLEGAVGYAHDNNVKVYVTVNTLIKNSEMADAIAFIRYLKDINADAVIIQDVGLLRAIGRIDIQKHASTQMGIHSRKGLEWCRDNGIDRAILSRELTLDETETVVKNSPVEVEVFTQGALCYAFSGGCLFSSIVGGRSGNRGECAQPCRKRYSSKERSGYLMNTADLYCIDHMKRLERMGIAAVKIEGRMRSPAHTYLTSKVYSMTKRGETGEELDRMKDLLMTIFNRGYGPGYMDGVNTVVQSVYPDNRGHLLGTVSIREKRFDPSGLGINVKDGLSIFRREDKIGGFKVTNLGRITVPFSISDGTYEIYRTYDPRIDEIKNIFSEVPRFTGTKSIGEGRFEPKVVTRKKRKADLSFYVSSVKVLNNVMRYADRIYFDMNNETDEAESICRKGGKEFVTILPRFSPADDMADGPVMVHNPGQMNAASGRVRYGSYHMNMFNSMFPNVLDQTTLSVELSKNEIRAICDRYAGRLEQMVFGRIELLVTRDPDMTNCELTDERDYKFPVYRDDIGLSHILNSADLLLIERMDELESMGIDSFGIDLRKRPSELASKVAEAFFRRDKNMKNDIREMCGDVTYGHYARGV